MYLSEVITHVKLKTAKKPLTTNKQAKQGKEKKKKNDLRSNQDDTTLLEAVSLWHGYKQVVRSLLSRCLNVRGAQHQRKEQGAREKNERGHACLSFRKMISLWWRAKC